MIKLEANADGVFTYWVIEDWQDSCGPVEPVFKRSYLTKNAAIKAATEYLEGLHESLWFGRLVASLPPHEYNERHRVRPQDGTTEVSVNDDGILGIRAVVEYRTTRSYERSRTAIVDGEEFRKTETIEEEVTPWKVLEVTYHHWAGDTTAVVVSEYCLSISERQLCFGEKVET